MNKDLDTDRIITEVRFRPALWDSSCEMYKNRDFKIKSWIEVCKEVIPNYDDLSDIEKKLSEKQVQQRWKTARDAYVRSRGTVAVRRIKRKKYIHNDCMHFLDKNTEDSNDIIETQVLSNAFQIDSWLLTQNKTEGSNKITSTKEEEANYDMPTTSQCSDSRRNVKEKNTHQQKKIQKKRNIRTENVDFNREMLKMFKENMKLMQNDDMAFFCSLLPITQSFNNHQKLCFRSEVLKKAMEIASLNPSDDPLKISHAGTV